MHLLQACVTHPERKAFQLEDLGSPHVLQVFWHILTRHMPPAMCHLLVSSSLKLTWLATGSEKHNVTLHLSNDEARSAVHHGRAFGHFSYSYPALQIAKLIENMGLTGISTLSMLTTKWRPTPGKAGAAARVIKAYLVLLGVYMRASLPPRYRVWTVHNVCKVQSICDILNTETRQ